MAASPSQQPVPWPHMDTTGLGHAGHPLQAGRRCSRPLCSRVADVILLFDYGARHVVLDWSPEPHDPNHLELCLEHAETFGPPHGWTVEDQRIPVVAVGAEPTG